MKKIVWKATGVIVTIIVTLASSAGAYSTACERLLGGGQVVNSGNLLMDALGCLVSSAIDFLAITSGWL